MADCQGCEFGPETCQQCQDPFNPNDPPPMWPDDFLPPDQKWANRGDLPPEVRCNLTPPLVNISAARAFEAYQKQCIDGGKGVIMIDVRTPEEVYWVGVPAQVNSIELKNGQEVVPYLYRTTLECSPCPDKPNFIKYDVKDKCGYGYGYRKVKKSVKDVTRTNLTGTSYNVPVEYIDPNTGEGTRNPLFGKQIDGLVATLKPTRIIFFCRSGQRSSIGCYYKFCPFGIFQGIISGELIAYEVETDVNGNGGFEGASYSNRYTGYRGFPCRVTKGVTEVESVSFKDMKLPIVIGTTPKTIEVDPETGAVIKIDELDAPPYCETFECKSPCDDKPYCCKPCYDKPCYDKPCHDKPPYYGPPHNGPPHNGPHHYGQPQYGPSHYGQSYHGYGSSYYWPSYYCPPYYPPYCPPYYKSKKY